MTKRKEPLVLIEWDDACSSSIWKKEVDIDPLLCRTVGWLMADTKKAKTVVMTRSQQGDVGGELTIPVGCIRRVRRIKE